MSSEAGATIRASFTADVAGWHRIFEFSSGMLSVDAAAKEIDDDLVLRLTGAYFIEIGDEYMPPTSFHVIFDTIVLRATPAYELRLTFGVASARMRCAMGNKSCWNLEHFSS